MGILRERNEKKGSGFGAKARLVKITKREEDGVHLLFRKITVCISDAIEGEPQMWGCGSDEKHHMYPSVAQPSARLFVFT